MNIKQVDRYFMMNDIVNGLTDNLNSLELLANTQNLINISEKPIFHIYFSTLYKSALKHFGILDQKDLTGEQTT